VFLQSDVYDAVAAMRDEFEQHAGDMLQLSDLHAAAAVFHWTRDQEQAALAAAAAADPSSTIKQHHQQEQQQECQADQGGVEGAAASGPAGVVGCDGSSDESNHQTFVSEWAAGGWLVDNPMGVPTEREHYVQAQGGKVFRVMLVKKQ
jgi:tRNA (guanine-N7-)-methyltransferase